MQNKPVIFISYSHEDEPTKPGGGPAWLSLVRRYLQPAVKDGIFDLFVDEFLRGGDPLDAAIERKLRACDIFILLVSANSMASDYVVDKEIRVIRERQANREDVHFYPLLLTPTPEIALAKLRDMVIRPENGTPLSSFADNEQLVQITAIADEIAKLAQEVVGRKRQPPPPAPRPAFVHLTGLPETAYEHLVGRSAELKRLDEAWADSKTNIVSLVAEGGGGKSALVNEWLTRLQADSYRGAETALGWSFYSQGSQERATSAERFLDWALDKLGIKLETTNASQKGEAIAEALARRRILLVLDGVEPLQHGPGPQVGQLKDLALQSLLRRLAVVAPAETHGLVVLTSRLAITDIARWKDTAAPVVEVEGLSDEAGAALLRDNGVWGTDKQLQTAAHEFGRHPLALSLLATFLKETQLGDVRRRDRVHAFVEDDDNPLHAHARRMMASYEEQWLNDQPVLLAVLHMVGLFDRPASGDCLQALRREPVIAGLTDEIVKLDETGWNRAVARLRAVRLLAPLDRSAPEALDAHPLVRAWFGERLKQKNEDAWRGAHGRLYEHLRDTTEEGDQPTLEGLAPLYQAIVHGCRAGRHAQALAEVYVERICRRNPDGLLQFYSNRYLRAIGSDLAALSWFFEKPYERPVAALGEEIKSWLLNVAAVNLHSAGRLAEALASMRAALRGQEEAENWRDAAVNASNLAEAELQFGDVAAAVRTAERSVAHADRSQDAFRMTVDRTTCAAALHAAGRRKEAEDLFIDAEQRQEKRQPTYPLLYSTQGFRYCDLLLAKGGYEVAFCRASETVEWARSNRFLLDIALTTLMLGRAHLGMALEHGARYTEAVLEASIDVAAARFDESVDGLRAAEHVDQIAVGLLARAAFRRSTGDWSRANRDLDEVEEIAEPGLMRLYLCDVALERARLALAQTEAFAPLNGMLEKDNPPKPEVPGAEEIATLKAEAEKQIKIADDYIQKCGYHRRAQELAELQAVSRGARTFASLVARV